MGTHLIAQKSVKKQNKRGDVVRVSEVCIAGFGRVPLLQTKYRFPAPLPSQMPFERLSAIWS